VTESVQVGSGVSGQAVPAGHGADATGAQFEPVTELKVWASVVESAMKEPAA
jgi:hypothetical protein